MMTVLMLHLILFEFSGFEAFNTSSKKIEVYESFYSRVHAKALVPR